MNLPDADNGVHRGIVPAVVLSCAVLPNAHWNKADVAPARKAKHNGKRDNGADVAPRRQPDCQHGDHAEHVGQQQRVHAAKLVGHDARQPTAGE